MAQVHRKKDAQNINVNSVCQSELLQECDLGKLCSACDLASLVQAAQIVLFNYFYILIQKIIEYRLGLFQIQLSIRHIILALKAKKTE
ncbi:hypothetical protein [Acinetobacter sp. ASP199]|uniref:hypothetical protein n=1 Tax=unclassified Acinetobacter TaxID=196816 RepID=UPI001F625000|nr:hypothetical protein [Acinetobacter sp. ASP199]